MGASGGFPIDLILFGMIAAFLVLRLKSILGKRTGFERPPQPIQPREAPVTPPPIQNAAPAQTAPGAQRVVPEPVSALGQTLAQMKTIDRNFAPGLISNRLDLLSGLQPTLSFKPETPAYPGPKARYPLEIERRRGQ